MPTCQRWASNIQKGEDIVIHKRSNRSGKPKVVDNDTLACLLVTLIDFPHWSSKQRAAYINGPNGSNYKKNKLKPQNLRKLTKKLNFSFKKAGFSPPHRNIIGYKALRVVCAKAILKIISDNKLLCLFADECSLCFTKIGKKVYGYIGVTPIVNLPLRNVTLNVLVMVAPGFGVIYRISKEKTNQYVFIDFIKKAIRIVRSFVCNSTQELGLIYDNASYHRTENVDNALQELKINAFPTVPYCPQLNECAEACFGYCKNNIEPIEIDAEQVITNKQLERIMIEKWDKVIEKFTSKKTANYYCTWKKILEQCANGLPLSSNHTYDAISNEIIIKLRSIRTKRLVDTA